MKKKTRKTKRQKQTKHQKHRNKLQLRSNDDASITIVTHCPEHNEPIDGFSVWSRHHIESIFKSDLHLRHVVITQPDRRHQPELEIYSDLTILVTGRTTSGKPSIFNAWHVFDTEELKHWGRHMQSHGLSALAICRADTEVQQYTLHQLVFETIAGLSFDSLKNDLCIPGTDTIADGGVVTFSDVDMNTDKEPFIKSATKVALLFIDESQRS